MVSNVLTKKIPHISPKLYAELFDTNSVFLALTQVIGKKILKFLVDSKISIMEGDGVSGRLYGFRSKVFFPFSGIIKKRKEITSRFFPKLCELELETEEDFDSEGLLMRDDIRPFH